MFSTFHENVITTKKAPFKEQVFKQLKIQLITNSKIWLRLLIFKGRKYIKK